eukprot:jgi/Antlo1/2196/973
MWIRKKSRTHGRYYFFNTKTHESTWERPKEGEFELFHILIKHADSRNPDMSLSRHEALCMCRDIYNDLRKNFSDELFMEKARRHSKCSSAKKGGYLGFVFRNEMISDFEKEAFKLEKGQMTEPVETNSGFHIIYRK